MKTKILGLLAVGLLAGFATSPARAAITFDFVAVCDTNCTGNATGVLTLADTYIFGSALTDGDVLSLSFASNLASWTNNAVTVQSSSGFLFNADGSFSYDVALTLAGDYPFLTFSDSPFWYAQDAVALPSIGNSIVFTPRTTTVPEPGTLALLGLGLLGLGMSRRRKAN